MLLETRALTKIFPGKSRSGGTAAVEGADLELRRGETVGLFGESGSGKSTLGLMIAGLLRPTSGQVLYKGEPVRQPYRGPCRKNIQILFQHPEISFNPVLPLMRSMEEPYKVHGLPFSADILRQDLRRFGLRLDHMARVPAELSGGELQRAALARILVLAPEVIVLDEPTSMLDTISQAQIMEILRAEQKERQTAYIFITHDPILCGSFSSRIYTVDHGTVAPKEVL